MSALIDYWNQTALVSDGFKYFGWYIGPWPVPPTLLPNNASINRVLNSSQEKITITQLLDNDPVDVVLYGLDTSHAYLTETITTNNAGGFVTTAADFYAILAISLINNGANTRSLVFSGATTGVDLLSTPPVISEYGILRPYYPGAGGSQELDGIGDYNTAIPPTLQSGPHYLAELSTENPQHNIKEILTFGQRIGTGLVVPGVNTLGYAIGWPAVAPIGGITTSVNPAGVGLDFESLTGIGMLDFDGYSLDALNGGSPLGAITRNFGFPFCNLGAGHPPPIAPGVRIVFAVFDPQDVGAAIDIQGITPAGWPATTVNTVTATLWDPADPTPPVWNLSADSFVVLDHTYDGNLAFKFPTGVHGNWMIGAVEQPMKLEGHPDYTAAQDEGIFMMYMNNE